MGLFKIPSWVPFDMIPKASYEDPRENSSRGSFQDSSRNSFWDSFRECSRNSFRDFPQNSFLDSSFQDSLRSSYISFKSFLWKVSRNSFRDSRNCSFWDFSTTLLCIEEILYTGNLPGFLRMFQGSFRRSVKAFYKPMGVSEGLTEQFMTF